MSLINDALKRAKETQQNNPPPPPPDLQFRTAEPASERNVTLVVVIVLTLLAIVGLAGFFVWWTVQPLRVVPRTPSAAVNPRAGVVTANPAPQTAPEPVPPVTPPAAAVETNIPVAATAIPAPATTATAPASTNAPPAVPEAAPPKPSPPKLQAIAYSPNRASAVIDGKTVSVGNRVGEFRVVSITNRSVTLTDGTQTIVLTNDE